ncbi:hypothetical protein IFM89_010558 [Coptis chinensis]|uniref:Uncharacterized protein n=1 Tax=Coptis chinensis TaxID=261450 RepID=A0A835M857_9MAGN|nr:hypothetical protein IFM89_010558 [Coptis chinensis]
MIYSLGGSSSCVDFVDTVIPYFFAEKDYIMLYHLDLSYLPSDVHGKKRARTQKTRTSLTALREIEHTLMFICVAAKHRKSWLKSMKEMNSQIRERSIHLLAFISRGAQCIAESSGRTAPLLCPPALKEEIDLNRKPSFINCKHGWFSLLPIGCVPRTHSPDQAIAIVSELCQTNKSKQMQCEIQDFCFLMLQMLEKSLYLEFCVAQSCSCGIRPVLGHVEDFSKEFKILVQVAEEHTSLKPSLKSLGQIISFVYPGMLQADGFLQVVHVLTRVRYTDYTKAGFDMQGISRSMQITVFYTEPSESLPRNLWQRIAC